MTTYETPTKSLPIFPTARILRQDVLDELASATWRRKMNLPDKDMPEAPSVVDFQRAILVRELDVGIPEYWKRREALGRAMVDMRKGTDNAKRSSVETGLVHHLELLEVEQNISFDTFFEDEATEGLVVLTAAISLSEIHDIYSRTKVHAQS